MTDAASRKLKLGAFLPGSGQHIAAWRHPDAEIDGILDIDYYKRLVRTAERGLFDLFFLADGLSLGLHSGAGLTSFGVVFEPVTLYTALSTVTEHIGFVATASTTYEDPFLLARKFASLDHISRGRSAWNIVTTEAAEAGKELAARTAEVIFTAQLDLASAQAFYRDVKSRLAKYGRSHDDLKIMPGVQPYVARTEAEARQKYHDLEDLILPELGLSLLSGLTGGLVDLSDYDLNSPLPELPPTQGNRSRQALIYDLARAKGLSIRELYKQVAGARGHWTIIGTPQQIADQLQEWFENEAADGFNIMPPVLPRDIDDFVDLVVPELQRRGLFRTEYEGRTLRENLGLARSQAPQTAPGHVA